VGVVADVASEATTLVLAREDKVNHRCSIEILESSDKGESPVREIQHGGLSASSGMPSVASERFELDTHVAPQ